MRHWQLAVLLLGLIELGAPAPSRAQVPAAPARYGSEWVQKTLLGYHRRYPKLTRLVRLGRSHEKRPLWALAIARRLQKHDPRPAVLLNGAHHGVELASIDIVMDAIEVLTAGSGSGEGQPSGLPPPPEVTARVAKWLDELVIWCVPVVNPDGVWASLRGNPRTGRKNGRDTIKNDRIDKGDGVDLNRNYPFRWGSLGERGSSSRPESYYYRGPQPGSEPETQAMMRLGESEHFAASASYHTGTVAVLAPYTIDEVENPTPNEAWTVGEEIVARMPPHPQGKDFTLRRNIYPVDGTDQDYYRHRHGTLALLIESARRDPRGAAERQAVVEAVRPSWMTLLDRYLRGPSLYGEVRDRRGRPVVAQVSLAETVTREKEEWTTRCRDGHFDRVLPGPGRYTLRVRVGDQPPLERIVDISEGRQRIDIKLDGEAPAASCPPEPPEN